MSKHEHRELLEEIVQVMNQDINEEICPSDPQLGELYRRVQDLARATRAVAAFVLLQDEGKYVPDQPATAEPAYKETLGPIRD